MADLLAFHRAQSWDFYWTIQMKEVLQLLFQYWLIGIALIVLVDYLLEKIQKSLPLWKILVRYSTLFLIGSLLFLVADLYDVNNQINELDFIEVYTADTEFRSGLYPAYPEEIASVDGDLKRQDVLAEFYVGSSFSPISSDFLIFNFNKGWLTEYKLGFLYPLAVTAVDEDKKKFEVRVAPDKLYSEVYKESPFKPDSVSRGVSRNLNNDYLSFSKPMHISDKKTDLRQAYEEYEKAKADYAKEEGE